MSVFRVPASDICSGFIPEAFPMIAYGFNQRRFNREISFFLELYKLFVLVAAGVSIPQEIFLLFGTVHCYSLVPLQNVQRWVIPQPFFAIHLRKRLQKRMTF